MAKENALPALASLDRRLAHARKRVVPKLTQAAVGELFGITGMAVSSWERGKTIPELNKLVMLARRYEVPVEWLLSDQPLPKEELELLELFEMVRAWPPRRRSPMLRILRDQIKMAEAYAPSGDPLGEMDDPPI